MSDLYDQVQNIDDRVTTLEDSSISTDMNADTLNNLTDFMQGNFWYTGQVTLSSGTASVVLNNITANSLVFLTGNETFPVGGAGAGASLGYTITEAASTLTINSTSGSDGRIINYLVFI